jgi:hypothetical protein
MMGSVEITPEYFQQRAKHSIRYFGNDVFSEQDWAKQGYEIAVEWHRLLNHENPSSDEINAIVERITLQKDNDSHSGILFMYGSIIHWQRWLSEQV